MRRYTSSPSFWGVYRRAAADRLSPIRYRAGWDHALLAELALLGEIRHVPETFYWRRDGGKPVRQLARAATAQARAGLSADDPLGDCRWRTPLITTAFSHVETFAAVPLALADRRALIAEVAPIFRARWLAPMRREALALRAALPDLIERIREADFVEAQLACAELAHAMRREPGAGPRDRHGAAADRVGRAGGSGRGRGMTGIAMNATRGPWPDPPAHRLRQTPAARLGQRRPGRAPARRRHGRGADGPAV